MLDLSQKRLIKRTLPIISIVLVVVITIVFGVVVFARSLGEKEPTYIVSGESMEPTLHDKEEITISQNSRFVVDDIVIFKAQQQWGQTYDHYLIKRIKGIPGDKVTYKNRTFLVNNQSIYSLPDDYTCDVANGTSKIIPKDEILTVGDNTDDSRDSLRAFCNNVKDPFVHEKSIIANGQYTLKKKFTLF